MPLPTDSRCFPLLFNSIYSHQDLGRSLGFRRRGCATIARFPPSEVSVSLHLARNTRRIHRHRCHGFCAATPLPQCPFAWASGSLSSGSGQHRRAIEVRSVENGHQPEHQDVLQYMLTRGGCVVLGPASAGRRSLSFQQLRGGPCTATRRMARAARSEQR